MADRNWPKDLQVSGRHDVWPTNAPQACRARSGNGHYCTLVKGHRGDHLTLLERWVPPTHCDDTSEASE